MASETKTRVSDKQRREKFYDSKIADILTDIESYEAFWEKCKNDGFEANVVIPGLVDLYTNGRIKLKKKKIVQEILVMDDED